MEGIAQFIQEFFGQFFGGIWTVLKGIGLGLLAMFNVVDYGETIGAYAEEYGGAVIFVAIIAALLLIAAIGLAVWGIVLLIKKTIRVRRTLGTQENLIEEVRTLNREVMRLNLEKDKILSMKVSQIGLSANELADLTGEEMKNMNNEGGDERFYRLKLVDEQWAEYVAPAYDNEITLPQIVDRFRNFCCSRLGLFYEPKIIRLFLASFASTRLIILQGISGTGKTSLPYAFGKFLMNNAVIASVQPSWRDRSELFGYFNEFTKKYTETELLTKMYEAKYNDNIYVSILDEMNIARVEYYFAEMLSILEMPTRDEWVVDLVPSVWDTDPKLLEGGKMKLPQNMWYIGTANNDDSTFAITDKVYDRAMPIDINTKGVAFEAPDTEPLLLSASHLEEMLNEAKELYKVSPETMKKVERLDDYVITHFRLAFGNRIVKQLREFVPAYVGCGGTELEGLDYVLAKKVLRKFESLNMSYIRDEIDGLVDYLDELFGEGTMGECIEYLRRLQRMI